MSSIDKKTFVEHLGALLCEAKPNLVKCEYKRGNEILGTNKKGPVEITENILENPRGIVPGDEYVVVTCENGYNYYINITANSLAAIADAVFSEMVYK